MAARRIRRPPAGFSLIELITVIGIMSVLMALVIGAARDIAQHAAYVETEQTIKGIEAGLANYFDDWGKFPYYKDVDPLMGAVAGATDRNATPSYCPIDARSASKGDRPAAVLYAALNMQERSGPYYRGAGGNIKNMVLDDQSYKVFVDGWGRPIHYFEPYQRPDGEWAQFPLLMSEGPKKDMPGVSDTTDDNITNYEVQQLPSGGQYFQ